MATPAFPESGPFDCNGLPADLVIGCLRQDLCHEFYRDINIGVLLFYVDPAEQSSGNIGKVRQAANNMLDLDAGVPAGVQRQPDHSLFTATARTSTAIF